MLVVAIPKSASSSLVTTLAERHGIPVRSSELRRTHFPRLSVDPAYRHLARFHREVKNIDRTVADLAAAPAHLVKHHWPPTRVNQELLRDVPKVVLLRDARDIVRAYKRGDDSGTFPLRSHEFCFALSERGWLKQAERIGLIAELDRFAAGWRAHAGDKLIVEFEDLTDDPKATLARIESYLGLPPSHAAELAREKFSRTPTASRGPLRVLLARRRLIGKWVLAHGSALLTGDPEAHRAVGRAIGRLTGRQLPAHAAKVYAQRKGSG